MSLSPPARRFLSVDVFRGLTVAFMILVNDAGDGRVSYTPLEHATWNGWTVTDLVFPTFLFLVGCSIVFSVQSRLRRGVPKSTIALQILRRAFWIFAIKMLISAIPFFHLSHLRIFGVLTRIALCYAAAALLFLYARSARVVLGTAVVLLVGYWLLLRFVPVPGYGMPGVNVPFLDPDGNLTSYIDRGFNNFTQHWLHTGSLYRKTRDPEGLLSTLPSIATSLLGILAGLALTRERKPTAQPITRRTSFWFALTGIACIALGELWSITFPINKNLWTSSYVLLAAGIALVLLALCHWVFDEETWHEHHRWLRTVTWPFLVFGSNAIFAYIVSDLYAITFADIRFHTASGAITSLHGWLYRTLFSHGNSTANTSLAWALCFVLICWIPTWLLWRKKWFLRV